MNAGLKTKEISFTLSGTFEVPEGLEPVIGHDGRIYAYRLPDGRLVRPQLVLGIESPVEEAYRDLSSDEEMDAIGFSCLEYTEVAFFE